MGLPSAYRRDETGAGRFWRWCRDRAQPLNHALGPGRVQIRTGTKLPGFGGPDARGVAQAGFGEAAGCAGLCVARTSLS
ncbi:hypothetical protein NBEOAGPD_4914 [Methylobacterium gregans]|uniref:Uncharacterized protein n=1 Tax=Methylobacterium gregans TaxID=374424 RepID=A0AA37MCR1_9HYPH|nr:hypothetical protein NBEOAGPD_4914 [Methylobacterium gregans]